MFTFDINSKKVTMITIIVGLYFLVNFCLFSLVQVEASDVDDYADEVNSKCQTLKKVFAMIDKKRIPTAQDVFRAYQEYVSLYALQSTLAIDYGSSMDEASLSNTDHNNNSASKSEEKYNQISSILSSPELSLLVSRIFPKIMKEADSNGFDLADITDDEVGRQQSEILMTPKLEVTLNKALSAMF